nr:unnamed protein product [Spirometra erinaceieuropaei]
MRHLRSKTEFLQSPQKPLASNCVCAFHVFHALYTDYLFTRCDVRLERSHPEAHANTWHTLENHSGDPFVAIRPS